MSIYKRASGRWAVLVDQEGGANAPRRRTSLGTFATKKEAEKAEREALQARDHGFDIVPSRLTLDEVFARFMRDAEARNLSGTTLHRYRQLWAYAAPISGTKVDRLRPVQLADLYANLQRAGGKDGRALAPRSVQHLHTLLHGMLAWAIRLELVARNVADAVEPPRGGRKKAVPYQAVDASRLVAEAGKTRHGPLVVFAFQTGLRRGELCALKWSDVNFMRRTATIRGSIAQIPKRTWYKATKTDLIATIALSNLAIEALHIQRTIVDADAEATGEHYRDDGYVFAAPGGGYANPGSIGNAVRRIARRAGLAVSSLHSMRHSTGSFLIADGVDIRTVAAILRHSATSTTLNIYAHELTGAQAAAVAGLDRRLRVPSDGNRMATDGPSSDEKTA